MVFNKHFKIFFKTSICSILTALPFHVNAASVSAKRTTNDGKPVKDAVVSLNTNRSVRAKKGQTFIIDQVNKTYVPHVTVIQAGNNISFPNKDNIRHHVYSFSAAKKFELPLYEGTPTNPVTFNKPGIVVLGCNIHDWMRAYIYVSETPYFGVSDSSGNIKIKNIPDGSYSLTTWHPRIKNDSEDKSRKISIKSNKKNDYQETITLKPNIKIRRAPKAKRRRY